MLGVSETRVSAPVTISRLQRCKGNSEMKSGPHPPLSLICGLDHRPPGSACHRRSPGYYIESLFPSGIFGIIFNQRLRHCCHRSAHKSWRLEGDAGIHLSGNDACRAQSAADVKVSGGGALEIKFPDIRQNLLFPLFVLLRNTAQRPVYPGKLLINLLSI